MSKTKFLGIPEGGKRAGWIEMEGGGSAGGGGGALCICFSNYGDYIGVRQLGNCTAKYREVYDAALSGRLAAVGFTRMFSDGGLDKWMYPYDANFGTAEKIDGTTHDCFIANVSGAAIYLFDDDYVEIEWYD